MSNKKKLNIVTKDAFKKPRVFIRGAMIFTENRDRRV